MAQDLSLSLRKRIHGNFVLGVESVPKRLGLPIEPGVSTAPPTTHCVRICEGDVGPFHDESHEAPDNNALNGQAAPAERGDWIAKVGNPS
jgi:hypothetical protein